MKNTLYLLLLVLLVPLLCAALTKPDYAQISSQPFYDCRNDGVIFDGVTDSRASFSAALYSAAAAGRSVIVGPGTMAMDLIADPAGTGWNFGVKIPSYSRILFQPNTSIVILNEGSSNSAVLWVNNATDVEIIGGRIVGDYDWSTDTGLNQGGMGIAIRNSGNIHINGTEIASCMGDGIYVSHNSRNVKIDNVWSHHNRRWNAMVVDGDDIEFNHCLFTNASGVVGSVVTGAGMGVEPGTGESVSNIRINNCIAHSNLGNAGFFTYSSEVEVTDVSWHNCYAYSNKYGFIVSNKSKRVGLIGCSTRDNTRYGIGVEQVGAGHPIASAGVTIQDVRISDCLVREALGTGIVLFNSSRCLIQGCDIISLDDAVNASAADFLSVQGNQIQSTGGEGISASGCTALSMSSNQVRYCAYNGVYVDSSSRARISGNILYGNNILATVSAGALYVKETPDYGISDNRISNGGGYPAPSFAILLDNSTGTLSINDLKGGYTATGVHHIGAGTVLASTGNVL